MSRKKKKEYLLTQRQQLREQKVYARRRKKKGFWKQKNIEKYNQTEEVDKPNLRLSPAYRNQVSFSNIISPPIYAISDMRLIENTEECLSFIKKLRDDKNISKWGNLRYIQVSLEYVTKIDYGTISILTGINDEYKSRNILFRTLLPKDLAISQFMIDSGYLNNLMQMNGKPFPTSLKSDMIFFEKGAGTLSDRDNRKISSMVKHVMEHLTGIREYCLPIKTVILEVCGNAIEWSDTESKQWLLGIKYGDHKVIFTVTDVGKGILRTLYRKFGTKFFELFESEDHILKGAFEKKYGSNTQELNRNKGLPAVNNYFKTGKIRNLKVITNSVILHFDNEGLSRTFRSASSEFRGTFYQWEMDKDCVNSLQPDNNGR